MESSINTNYGNSYSIGTSKNIKQESAVASEKKENEDPWKLDEDFDSMYDSSMNMT